MSDRPLAVDDALTAGYAKVHALEAEWLRIERRLAEAALAGGDPGESDLAARKRVVEAKLVDLRASLVQLRAAADRARSSYAAASDDGGPAV